MEIKILQVFYGKDGLPYKDKDRQVHFPITGTGFLGASNTTKIKFYYDELDNLDETTWVAVSKLPNGKVGNRVLESYLDEELNEHYALLELDNYYTQYKGDVFISLQGYQGGVDFDYDEENSQYEIHGTPTIAATGSIKFTINYANQFVGSGQTDNINFQRILAALGTKLGMRAYSEHVEELPSEGSPDVFYVVNDDPNDPNLANIYVWNQNTRHYIWVGDNTLDLGNYYTSAQGEQIEGRVESLENELSSVANGSPKGVYDTLEDLENAFPSGNNNIYLVGTDWYYWNGSAWTDGGTYLSAGDESLYALKDSVLGNQYKAKDFIGLKNQTSTDDFGTQNRWFAYKKIKKGSIIKSLSFYNHNVPTVTFNFEIWTLVNNTLTKIREIPFTTTGTGNYTLNLNFYAYEDIMISWVISSGSAVGYVFNIPANDGGYYLGYIADKTSSSLAFSSVGIFSNGNPCMTISVEEYELGETIEDLKGFKDNQFENEYKSVKAIGLDEQSTIGGTCGNANRWFINKLIKKGCYLKTFDFYDNALHRINIELWKKEDNTLTLYKSIAAVTSAGVNSVALNIWLEQDTIIAFTVTGGSSAIGYVFDIPANDGKYYLGYTVGTNYTEIADSGISWYSNSNACVSINYEEYDNNEKLEQLYESQIAAEYKDISFSLGTNSDNSAGSGNRYFVAKVIKKGSFFKNFVFYDNTAHQITFSIWALENGTLSLIESFNVRSIGGAATTVEINKVYEKDIILCYQSSQNAVSYSTTKVNGAYYMFVSSDLSSEELQFNALGRWTLNPCITLNYLQYGNDKVITVGENNCDFEEIQDALDTIVDTENVYTIIVNPKKTPYKRFSMIRTLNQAYPWSNVVPRKINIIGLEKEHCVVQDDKGDYANPPAELMTNGTIKNITFVMTHNDQNPSATQGGYAAHIDSRTRDDIGYRMVIENCIFKSDNGPGVGIGLHQNCDLVFENCEFISTALSSYQPYEGYRNIYDYGCFFCHSSTIADRTNQKLTLKNCNGSVIDGNKSLWVSQPGSGSPNMYVTLINNVFWNYKTETPAYSLSNTFTYNPMNFGNNNQ